MLPEDWIPISVSRIDFPVTAKLYLCDPDDGLHKELTWKAKGAVQETTSVINYSMWGWMRSRWIAKLRPTRLRSRLVRVRQRHLLPFIRAHDTGDLSEAKSAAPPTQRSHPEGSALLVFHGIKNKGGPEATFKVRWRVERVETMEKYR